MTRICPKYPKDMAGSHLQFAFLCRNSVRLNCKEVEGVPDRVLHRVEHLVNLFTLFLVKVKGILRYLLNDSNGSWIQPVLSSSLTWKSLQGYAGSGECPKSALLSQNRAHSNITKSGDVRAAEVRARLDSLRIGAHRDSALNQPIIRTEKCTENIDIDFSKKRLWDPFIRPGKKKRVFSNVLFFWIQCYPFRPDCISRSPEIFLF